MTDILEGTVYPALARLEREGRVSARLVSSNAGPARKYYRPTPAGYEALAAGTASWSSLADVVGSVLRPPVPTNRSKEPDMTHPVTWIDRLRIERAVWALDQRLYDLPRRSRIAKRREVRENLLTAAHDVGTTDALRHLGSSRQLAAEYLSAEFGDEPRPSWMAAAMFLLTGQLVLTSLLSEAASRSATASPPPTRTPRAPSPGAASATCRTPSPTPSSTAEGSFVGGAWTPLAWVIWLVATVLVGRLWRVASIWRRKRATTTTT